MKTNVFVLLLTIFYACTSPAQKGNISTAQFEQEMQQPGVQVLDVRTANEFKTGHIKNALQADWMSQQQFADRVQYLDKSKPVLVYCATGVRAGKAMDWLMKNGFTKVSNLSGGFTQWKLDNKPFEGATDEVQLSGPEYANYINSAAIVLIDFGAEWCPPCKKMEPVLAQLQSEWKDTVKLVKVDGGINTNIMQQNGVAALPTFILYHNGKETWRKQGLVTADEFKTEIAKLQ